MNETNLHPRIANVLLQLKLLSEANTGRWPDSHVDVPRRAPRPRDEETGRVAPWPSMKASGHQHGESRPPSKLSVTLYDHHRTMLARAEGKGYDRLLSAVLQAEEALMVARKAPPKLSSDDRPEASENITRRMVEDEVGRTPEEVAAKYRCSAAHVRAARSRYAPGGDPDPRDPETGERRDEPADKRNQARELRREGRPVRLIALLLGVTKSTVHRWTDEREAA